MASFACCHGLFQIKDYSSYNDLLEPSCSRTSLFPFCLRAPAGLSWFSCFRWSMPQVPCTLRRNLKLYQSMMATHLRKGPLCSCSCYSTVQHASQVVSQFLCSLPQCGGSSASAKRVCSAVMAASVCSGRSMEGTNK